MAQFHLGNAFYSGQGVTQDFKEAMSWFKLAASQGHHLAQDRLEMMKDFGFLPDGTRVAQGGLAPPPAPRHVVKNVTPSKQTKPAKHAKPTQKLVKKMSHVTV